MKKLLVLLGILAAFSLMGCPKDPKDPVNPPASDPIENEDTGGDSTEDEGSTTEIDIWTADEEAGYDFGTGCEYPKGIKVSTSSLKAGDTLTFYYTLTEIENEYGIYAQLKLAYGYTGDALPGLADVGANEYGQVLVTDTSYNYVLTEADVESFSDTNIMMVFGHNVILKKITVK